MNEYIRFPLIDGTEHIVSFKDGQHYEQMFPNLNVAQEFCSMLIWLEANPKRRKTRRGINHFIGNWLIKATRDLATPPRVRMEAAVGRRITS